MVEKESLKFTPLLEPTPERQEGDPLFDAIWGVIKNWDINVRNAYRGPCAANADHVRAIYDAVKSMR